MNSQTEIQKLLQLKKLETPGEQYFDRFVDAFHEYQRSEILQEKPSNVDQFITWFQSTFAITPRYVRGMATAAVAVVVCTLLLPVVATNYKTHEPVIAELSPRPKQDTTSMPYADALLQQPELIPATTTLTDASSSSSRVRYVTGEAALASYETFLSF